jgi:uncharacterized protein YecT (DUF1311 family)
LVSFLAGSLLAAAPRTRAASFDCAKAATPTEKLICGDPELSQLDGQLAETYRRELDDAFDPNKLRAKQHMWLRTERDACADAACLKKVYAQRIAALTARPGPAEKALGLGTVESAPGDAFKFAPLLDKATGDAAATAYGSRRNRGGQALASGSFTRAGSDEVLLVDSTNADLESNENNSVLVIMEKTATGFRVARRMGLGYEFEIRARITGPGRPDRLFMCDSKGRRGLYPMICGFLGQGFFGPRGKDGQVVTNASTDVQMGSVQDCGPSVSIEPGKLRLQGDRLAVEVVIEEYDAKDCKPPKKLTSKTYVLTYELGVKGVRLLTPIPPRINELTEQFELQN